MVEHWSPKPGVASSSLATLAIKINLGAMKFEDVENARIALVEKRKKIFRKSAEICAVVFVVLAAVAVATIIASYRGSIINTLAIIFPTFIVPMFIAIIVVAIVVNIKTRNEMTTYQRAYKGYFVAQQLAKYFTDIKYDHEKGLDKEILKNTGMIHTGDRYRSNDLVCAKYKNVVFMQADVTIEDEHEDSDGDTHYVTVFKGRYMIFEFPKKFDFKMMVTSHFEPSCLGAKMKKIELESTDFNKDFSVYAEDGFEAFYLLDPAFIASVEDLNRAYNKRVALYFVDNKLFIGINNGNDSFEPPNPSEPIKEKAEIEKNSRDIQVITDFVDRLRLDRDRA